MTENSTFQRSCEHWSEAGRAEMDHFYALAAVDYKYIANAINWGRWLEEQQKRVGQRQLKLLDIACGSGKFPRALRELNEVIKADLLPIQYSLLDPSKFSLSEARANLGPPFHGAKQFEPTLQALNCGAGEFDIAWATHALYAVPVAELEKALYQLIYATSGVAFIAHASEASHYLRFYRYYIEGFKDGIGEPFSSAENIAETLTRMGISYREKTISYDNLASEEANDLVQGYLQRCVFDDSIDLRQMCKNPITGNYLEKCVNKGSWCFKQDVTLFFIQVH